MVRMFAVAGICFALCANAGWAAEGFDLNSAFPTKSHDFGTVAVAAKTEFHFPVHNRSPHTMHIQTVRASCGCTTPIISDPYIAPGQSSTIVARFNTDTFRGQRGATLTVVVDQPTYGEVRLQVNGYIRSDMVFHPGAIEFGRINQGERATKSSHVMYAGRGDWQVVDVQSNQPWLMPTLQESQRSEGQVRYQLQVDVREDAPEGFFQDELVLITNDRTRPRVPLRVSGQVESPLRISPQAIALGSLKPGESVSEKMILLGRDPFVLESITAEGWDIELPVSAEAKKTHLMYPKFTFVGQGSGPQKATIEIKTAGPQTVTAKVLLTADVREQ